MILNLSKECAVALSPSKSVIWHLIRRWDKANSTPLSLPFQLLLTKIRKVINQWTTTKRQRKTCNISIDIDLLQREISRLSEKRSTDKIEISNLTKKPIINLKFLILVNNFAINNKAEITNGKCQHRGPCRRQFDSKVSSWDLPSWMLNYGMLSSSSSSSSLSLSLCALSKLVISLLFRCGDNNSLFASFPHNQNHLSSSRIIINYESRHFA